ncbi:MAG: sulfite exporter TauE/SafE family protein [Candidatus Bathyarchaeia archaeon]
MLDLILILCLTAMGFFVGTLSSFFGFGGGFIIVPFLVSLGFPINISVGTSTMEIFISSLIASLKHRRLGNVGMKAGLIIAFASIVGAEFGAQLIEWLEGSSIQHMDILVSLIYVLVLYSISAYMTYEGLISKRRGGSEKKFWRGPKIPQFTITMQQDMKPTSAWVLVIIGFLGGLFAGFLGTSGGLILVPLLIYVVGYKPSVAAGTCIFERLLSCLYASLTHTLKGNIDFMLAALMFLGSLIGVQVGVSATKYISEASFKGALVLYLGFISLSVMMRLISLLFGIFFLEILSRLIIFLASFSMALLIIAFLIGKI